MVKVRGKIRIAPGLKKKVVKIEHGPFRSEVPANMASPGPPLGTMLGQRHINIQNFCKDFNDLTKDMKPGVPIPTRVFVNPDRSYQIILHTPPSMYFLKQAAGINKGTTKGEISGKITHRHLYEIAKIKQQDPPLQCTDLKEICKLLIKTCRSIGIEIVRQIDPEEYDKFLKERAEYLVQHRKELDELKEAKILRTAA